MEEEHHGEVVSQRGGGVAEILQPVVDQCVLDAGGGVGAQLLPGQEVVHPLPLGDEASAWISVVWARADREALEAARAGHDHSAPGVIQVIPDAGDDVLDGVRDFRPCKCSGQESQWEGKQSYAVSDGEAWASAWPIDAESLRAGSPVGFAGALLIGG